MSRAPKTGVRIEGRAVRHAVALAVLAGAGCDEYLGCAPTLTTEEGQLQLADEQVVVGACGRLRSPGPLLVGTRWCPRIECHPDVPGCEKDDQRLPSDQVTACFEQRIEGPVARDGECFVIEGEGSFGWFFDPIGCPANTAGFMPIADRIHLPTVGVEGIEGHFDSPGDAYARRNLHPGPLESFPEDAQLGPGRVAYVLADTEVPLAIVLGHPDHAEPVGWQPVDWTTTVETTDGDPVSHTFTPEGLLVLSVQAGAMATVAVERNGERVEVGMVEGVAPDEIETLEIVVGYRPVESDAGFDIPIGARAVARRSDGTPVWGIPAEWEVIEGAFPLWQGEEPSWGPEYVALMDTEGRGCHPPADHTRTFEAALVARWEGLEDEIELSWREEVPDQGVLEEIGGWFTDDDYQKSELCQGPGFPGEGGCGCRSGGGGWGIGVLGMLAVLGLRRRRS